MGPLFSLDSGLGALLGLGGGERREELNKKKDTRLGGVFSWGAMSSTSNYVDASTLPGLDRGWMVNGLLWVLGLLVVLIVVSASLLQAVQKRQDRRPRGGTRHHEKDSEGM